MKVMMYRTEESVRTVVTKPVRGGSIDALFLDFPVRVKRVPGSEERYMSPATYRGKPYPLARARRKLGGMVRRHGATSKKVRSFLRAMSEEAA